MCVRDRKLPLVDSLDNTRVALNRVRGLLARCRFDGTTACGGKPRLAAGRNHHDHSSDGQFTWSLRPTWEPVDARIYYASTARYSSQVWGMLADGRGQEQKAFGLADLQHRTSVVTAASVPGLKILSGRAHVETLARRFCRGTGTDTVFPQRAARCIVTSTCNLTTPIYSV